MPIFNVGCECGYRGEKFLHNEFGRQQLHRCGCGKMLTFMLSAPNPLTYFEEGRARTIYNMGDEPVVITSPGQHERECKKRGIAPMPARRGEKNCWA